MSVPVKPRTDPKKAALLAVLLVGAAIALYVNVFSSDSPAPVIARPASAPVVTVQPPTEPARREASKTSVTEFKPRQGTLRPEDRPDPATIDPTIRLDLLAKIQAVEPEATLRNIFQYGAPPPPPAPPKPVELPKGTPKIPVATATPPPTAPPPPVGPPPAPQAPPMTFKYYGFKVSKRTGRREAFLLDGEEILIGGENDTFKAGRYRIVRISPNTVTIEDTQFKANQTLTLQEEAAV